MNPAAYAELIDWFRQRDYRIVDFEEAKPDKRHLILRHDVDFSLQRAVRLGELEAELGVRATYFILLRSPFYNPLAPGSIAAVDRLAMLGHRIGLHFDASLYSEESLDDAAADECALARAIFGIDPEMISFHRPAKSLLGSERSVAGRPHTYMPRFMSEIGYCSDSQGAWRYGSPESHEAVRDGRALHLLTHPIWWTSEDVGAVAKLETWMGDADSELRQHVADNCQPYREMVASIPGKV